MQEGTLSASSSSSELITKTSHSEMKAGSAECMLLSPRGIFTAGNVSVPYPTIPGDDG